MRILLLLLITLVFGCSEENSNNGSVPANVPDDVITGYGTVTLVCGYNDICAQTCKVTLLPYSNGLSFTINEGEQIQTTIQAGTWQADVSKYIYCSGTGPILVTFGERFILLDGGVYTSTF